MCYVDKTQYFGCKITIKIQKRAPVSANNCIFSHPLAQQALLTRCGT